MIAAVEAKASEATSWPQAGLCTVWTESAVEAETRTEGSEVSHELVCADLMDYPAQSWRTIVNIEVIRHLQSGPRKTRQSIASMTD